MPDVIEGRCKPPPAGLGSSVARPHICIVPTAELGILNIYVLLTTTMSYDPNELPDGWVMQFDTTHNHPFWVCYTI